MSGLESLDKPVPPEKLEELCVAAMLKAGLKKKHAEITARVLVSTDLWGVFTHGTKQLRGLLKNIRDGRLDPKAEPEVVRDVPAAALVDGHFAMPMVSSTRAMNLAIEKARELGTAFVGVTHSGHFGAAGYYANMAAENDMIGLSMCNVEPFMTVPGAKGRVLGTNPIAYAIPAGEEPTVFLDIATSAVAVSKVFAARARGEEVPPTWFVDADGNPSTDPSKIDDGAMLPMAGHKGYGIAVLIEVLSAVLTGSAVMSEVKSWVLDLPEPSNQGHAFMVINPSVFMPVEEFKTRVDAMIREIKSAPKALGATRIYLPGEMEWERREKFLKNGIELPSDVVANLKLMAEEWGVEL